MHRTVGRRSNEAELVSTAYAMLHRMDAYDPSRRFSDLSSVHDSVWKLLPRPSFNKYRSYVHRGL